MRSLLTTDDLITLPFGADLTEAGIAYACRSFPFTYDRMGGSPYHRLRRIVLGIAVELAFRRLLAARGVPHDTLGATPFTEPDRYDVALGNRRCDLKSFLISEKGDIRRVRRDPGILLRAAALVPLDQSESGPLGEEDLYVFAFASALVTRQRQELARALSAGQPTFLIYPMPPSWIRPARWSSLGHLSLRSEAGQPAALELGGQDSARNFVTERLTLAPLRRTQAQQEFYALAYLRALQLPSGAIEVRSLARKATHLVQPGGWGNIWVYGMEICLAGYLTRREFLRRARLLPAGSRVLQYARTRTPNLAVPVGELRPLADLFGRVQAWAGA